MRRAQRYKNCTERKRIEMKTKTPKILFDEILCEKNHNEQVKFLPFVPPVLWLFADDALRGTFVAH